MRRYLVTGAASGMGKATVELLRRQGMEVVTLDIKDADIIIDLSRADERAELSEAVRLRTDALDAVIACAGLSIFEPVTMAVNYFGAVATLEQVRPLLAQGKHPRALAIASYAATMPTDDEIINAALSGDEAEALARCEGKGVAIYSSSKAALIRWCRAAAVSGDWAGSGILLNSVSPGIVDTPMTAHRLRDSRSFAEFKQLLPLPIDRYALPDELAHLFAFLTSPENSYLVGQNIYADGGTEALVRGPEQF